MKDCNYPNCQACDHKDCDMSSNDIAAMLKRRRRHLNPQAYRQKQNDYRSRYRENLPHCDGCTQCVQVLNQKGNGYRRICVDRMRLIEQKVSNSPQWCKKREKGVLKDA